MVVWPTANVVLVLLSDTIEVVPDEPVELVVPDEAPTITVRELQLPLTAQTESTAEPLARPEMVMVPPFNWYVMILGLELEAT